MSPKKPSPKSRKQPSAPIAPVSAPTPSPSPEWVAARLDLAADAVDEFVRAVTVNFDRDGDGYVSPPPFTVDHDPNPRMDAAWNTPSLLYRGVEYIAEILFAVGLTRHTGEKLAPHATHAWVSGGHWSCGEPWTKLAERIVPIGQGLAVRRAEYQAGFTDEASGLTFKRVPGDALEWAAGISDSLRAAAQSARGEKPAPPRLRGRPRSAGSSESKPDERILRLGKWFATATNELLSADLLRRAAADHRLNADKSQGHNLYDVCEVMKLYRQYAHFIKDALSKEVPGQQ